MDVTLFVNGEEIELNKFVADILGGTIRGAVSSLHGIRKDWTEITIKIKR